MLYKNTIFSNLKTKNRKQFFLLSNILLFYKTSKNNFQKLFFIFKNNYQIGSICLGTWYIFNISSIFLKITSICNVIFLVILHSYIIIFLNSFQKIIERWSLENTIFSIFKKRKPFSSFETCFFFLQ